MDLTELQQAEAQPLAAADARLCGAVLGAPIAWAASFAVSYGLVYPAQDAGSKAIIYVVSLLGALSCVVCIGLGVRGLRHSHLGPQRDRAQRDRTQFLASCACLAGVLFLLAIVAHTVPVIMLPLEGR